MVKKFVLHITIGVIIGSLLLTLTKGEHHEIPIISNHSNINNSFAITNLLNFTSLLNIDDQEGAESYDDGVGLMEDYDSYLETSLNEDADNGTVAAKNDDDDDEDADFKFLLTRGRWSYAPGFVERMCRGECQNTGKPFGRLLGTRCQCFCPLNAPTLELCATTRSCDGYCASLGYAKGGDCVYNNVCFCFCKKSDPYDVSRVYTE